MDKNKAIKIAERYLAIVDKKYPIEQALLFGSFAKGTNHKDSDIDLAIFFSTTDDVIEMQAELLKMRRDNELLIEPHPFRIIDFKPSNPVAAGILKNEVEIKRHLAPER